MTGTPIAEEAPVAPNPTFATFWAGPPLSPYERACLGSFTRQGYELTLYSFERYDDLPPGVRLADAAEITPRSDLELFRYGAKPDLSHFSDYFRYALFRATDHVWIDSDVFLVRPFDIALPPTLLTKEHATSLCGAIMRIDRRELDLDAVIARTRGLAGRPLRWGETGPLLLTDLFGASKLMEVAYEPKHFYPVLYDVFWRVFLPEERDACAEACRDAYTLHLWNNIVVQLGIWKQLAPPSGSYLHELFAEAGMLEAFSGTYPADVMRRMIDNWRLRFTGSDVGVGNLVRQLLPGALRTARRRGWIRPADHA